MKLKIEKLIFEGFGLGHSDDGRTVFVRKSVPGDELEVKVIKENKSFAEAEIQKVIKPSDIRIESECRYFDKCGGCEHMNISYPDQLRLKGEIFNETLSRAGLNIKAEPIIAGSDSPLFYRNSIRFFFVEKDGQITFDRHNYLYEDGFVEVDKCLLQSETCNEILEKLKHYINNDAFAEGEAGAPASGETGMRGKKSFWQLKIREGKQTGQFMVEIITHFDDLPGEKGIVECLKNIEAIKSIYHVVAPNRNLKNMHRRLLFGSPIIHEKIGKYKFQISPESFFQTNSLGVKTLYDIIKQFADIKIGDTILDLYCGTGTIGIYLSTLAKKVIGVELVPEAIRDAKDNAKINHISNCDFICSDGEKYLKQQFNNSTIQQLKIIVDPPRAGLTNNIIKLLVKTKSSIIYTSCNPATFARDIKTFKENGLKLKKVQPIDMFPQTHHIECVGILAK
jgi:23S rRNA (uracil1939-C5)-methyltransferase